MSVNQSLHLIFLPRHPLFGRHMHLSSGSGFVVTHSGVIVTNAHVVTTAAVVTGSPQLRVQLHDGNAYEAVVRDIDRKADIATIKVNPQVREEHMQDSSIIFQSLSLFPYWNNAKTFHFPVFSNFLAP